MSPPVPYPPAGFVQRRREEEALRPQLPPQSVSPSTNAKASLNEPPSTNAKAIVVPDATYVQARSACLVAALFALCDRASTLAAPVLRFLVQILLLRLFLLLPDCWRAAAHDGQWLHPLRLQQP
ncbi:hypothetical protein EMIHUDRAFT_251587 [Emiliania huxleyi CCMP1516]|uniref:Uncharacterized protein n=2 Tax=Emiliania huxleyi TaxID=2903 RepID=A0A0D3KT72_EMIH1|nr:hypothetical protein EMIHUDRAFT_251587 [Emiliania huxleyi CCMP1516]EOD38957.1 hypothetical protein EMIHUDRAFT_251587 [Emiliania huxleyi CCMP1516]|eukprot:XP_005791386.1 hypothetical protein EMIHUDRAFT_251587 [Emiliania huxleyi CCMP1516]